MKKRELRMGSRKKSDSFLSSDKKKFFFLVARPLPPSPLLVPLKNNYFCGSPKHCFPGKLLGNK